mmetsp:Transcript_29954/g.26481  ORF Transcript_29954/g.26481 Transcript_29954/m.26481 type:complete len:84 (-) Transcript_29954:13-264(-)
MHDHTPNHPISFPIEIDLDLIDGNNQKDTLKNKYGPIVPQTIEQINIPSMAPHNVSPIQCLPKYILSNPTNGIVINIHHHVIS